MIKQLTQLIVIQFWEFVRNPGVLFWAMGFPILMAWGLGIAFTQKGELVRTVAVVDGQAKYQPFRDFLGVDATFNDKQTSRTIQNDKMGDTQYHFLFTDWKSAELMVKRGKAVVILEETRDNLQYHFDPLNPEAQLIYLQLSGIIGQQRINTTQATISPLVETGTRYIDFLIPGLMAMGVMMSCMWGISYSLIDKRSKKLIRRMVVTPMRKTLFLLSHFISRLILSMVESALLLLFAWWYFDITIQGSVLGLFLIFTAGVMAFFGIAVATSSRTDNPQIGNGLINLVVMPMMVMSGIFFSYHNFPDAIIPFIQKFPLTMVADGIRSIFIEGAGLAELWPSLVVLTIIGLSFFGLGLKLYRWY